MLARLLRHRTVERAAVPGQPAELWWPSSGTAAWSGTTVTSEAALSVPALGRGVDLIAGTVAGLPIDAWYGDLARSGAKVPVSDPMELPPVVYDPVPGGTRWHWVYAVVNDLILWGNHVSVVAERDDSGWPTSVVPVDIEQVAILHEPYPGGEMTYRIYGYEFSASDVLHISSGAGANHPSGRGVIQQYAEAIGTVRAANEYAARFYSEGSMPTGVITHPNPNLTATEAAAVKAAFINSVGARQRKPAVLPVGANYTPIVGDAEKAQLVEARSWDSNVIATILGIPPVLLGLEQRGLVYQNSEFIGRTFTIYTLQRWTRLLEFAIDRYMLPDNLYVTFNFEGLVMPDQQTMTETLARQVEAGLRTVDEARAVMDLPPLSDDGPELGVVPDVSDNAA